MFPDISPEEILLASKRKLLRKLKKKDGKELPKEKPAKMKVKPMDPDGNFKVDFSVPMMAPGAVIDQKIYGGAFGFEVSSMSDESTFEGKFGSTRRERLLAATDDGSSSFAFKPVVTAHTPAGITMGIEFDDPT